jgi:hypothetical protein
MIDIEPLRSTIVWTGFGLGAVITLGWVSIRLGLNRIASAIRGEVE